MFSLYFSNQPALQHYFVTWRLMHDDQQWQGVDERMRVAQRVEQFFSQDPYQCLGYVVFDDHIHMILAIPPSESLDLVMHRFERDMTLMLEPHGNFVIRFRPAFLSYRLNEAEDVDVARRYLLGNPAKHGLTDTGYILKLFDLNSVSAIAGDVKVNGSFQNPVATQTTVL